MTLPTFAVGDQLPMFVDVDALMASIDSGAVHSGDRYNRYVDGEYRPETAAALFKRKLEDVENNYGDAGDLYSTRPSLIGVGDEATQYCEADALVADGHHRLASWWGRGMLAPILVCEDSWEISASLDDYHEHRIY